MEYAVAFVVALIFGSIGSWIILMIVTPIAGRIAGFGYPGIKEAAGKLALVALAMNATSAALGFVHFVLAWVGSLIVFGVLMYRWFDTDVFGFIVILVVMWLLQMFVLLPLLAGLA